MQPHRRVAAKNGDFRTRVTFNKEARLRFLAFATAPESLWSANFRDLSASITRMATFAPSGRITETVVGDEIKRLRSTWRPAGPASNADMALANLIGSDTVAEIDRFDRVQLAEVLQVCRESRSLSAAGRTLFAASRTQRTSTNDADRLRKYLARFQLDWAAVSRGR